MVEQRVMIGDCAELLPTLKAESIDLMVTDPPYGYSFMGKEWDKAVPSIDIWKECLRVLKPGAFAFVMSAPRLDVQSEMGARLREAGFDIAFTPMFWAYASGFPKAANMSKMIDKKLGAAWPRLRSSRAMPNHDGGYTGEQDGPDPITPQAKALDGAYAGFQPKPAVEVIITAMKPLAEKNYLEQAMANGKGVTWLDFVRLPYSSDDASSPHEPCQDGFDDTAWSALAQVCEHVQGSLLPKEPYNKSCTAPALHKAAPDGTQGTGLSRWLESVQNHRPLPNAEIHDLFCPSIVGSQSYCPACLHLYDGLFRLNRACGPDELPSLVDVLAHIHTAALGHIHSQTNQYIVHLSSADDLRQLFVAVGSDYGLPYCTDICDALKAFWPVERKMRGRFPANLLVSDEVLEDGREHVGTGGLKPQKPTEDWTPFHEDVNRAYFNYGDSGGFSRYFDLDAWWSKRVEALPQEVRDTFPFLICPKAKPEEKNKGLSKLPKVNGGTLEGRRDGSLGAIPRTRNTHPTVKPLQLMSYLITLGSRPGDVILDPFAGSGTTGAAARSLGRSCISIERDPEYARIAMERSMSNVPSITSFGSVI